MISKQNVCKHYHATVHEKKHEQQKVRSRQHAKCMRITETH